MRRKGIDGSPLHHRELSVLLLSGLRCADVWAGLDSRRYRIGFPTTHPPEGAGGFDISGFEIEEFSGTSGEVANAQVCKTCIRGFNSHLVLQA